MIGKLQCVVLDCADVMELARFYASLLGGEVNRPDPRWSLGDDWATLHGDGDGDGGDGRRSRRVYADPAGHPFCLVRD
ncbi:VOC family protein [Streptomyces roseolus]|uniref:VOC family protein n=1 Tax=Streptomyces roseolus TaxID=67358 RepID=UPI00366178DE